PIFYEYVRPTWETSTTTNANANHNGHGGTASSAPQFIAPSSELDTTDTSFDLTSDAAETDTSAEATDGYIPTFPPIDRTPKMFINGKQVRPDSGYSRDIYNPEGQVIGQVGEGNRKDIRNAVEAAQAASGWATTTTHNRAQILYYIAENLAIREEEFARRIVQQTVRSLTDAMIEVETAISRLLSYSPWADKYEGSVHRP